MTLFSVLNRMEIDLNELKKFAVIIDLKALFLQLLYNSFEIGNNRKSISRDKMHFLVIFKNSRNIEIILLFSTKRHFYPDLCEVPK